MEQRNPVFLVDANSLITPYRGYYSFDLAPKFWKGIEAKLVDESILLMDKVYDELFAGKDSLSDWISKVKIVKIKHKNQDIITIYGEILTHIQTSGLYTAKALTEWSDNRIADPWLVACAKANSYTIVTFEVPTGLSKGSPSSHPKIPDVCKVFSVPYMNLFDMMRVLSINIS